jgi:hypothetical protein
MIEGRLIQICFNADVVIVEGPGLKPIDKGGARIADFKAKINGPDYAFACRRPFNGRAFSAQRFACLRRHYISEREVSADVFQHLASFRLK